MTIQAAHGVPLSGPADARRGFLKKTALLALVGIVGASIVSVASTIFAAPTVYEVGGGLGGMIAILGSFLIAHKVARGMVYGDAKVAGLILAVVMEGFALGFLLLTTMFRFGASAGVGLIAECMMLTCATTGGLLVYVWFNRSELSLVKAGLSMLALPMLILMALSWAFPLGGTIGTIVAAVFVLVSGAALLYRLNAIVHEYDEDMHIEAAYELTMAILVLFWNLLTLLNKVRR